MTESSTESALARWKAPECPFEVEYSARVLDDIRLAVVDAFFSLPRGGAEIGGILLGHLEGSRITITDYEALDCEHAMGPSFSLSQRDLTRMALLVEGAKQNGRDRQPVGWYHSHTRSGIFLSDADQDIHNRFFPEPWQLALVVKPHTFDPTTAGFFFRERDGSIRGSASYQDFTLEALPVRPAPVADVPPPPPPTPQPLRRAPEPQGPVLTIKPELPPEPPPPPRPAATGQPTPPVAKTSVQPEAVPKSEPKPVGAKPELKPESKPELKLEPKPEAKLEVQTEAKQDVSTSPKFEPKLEPKPALKYELKPEPKPVPRPVSRPVAPPAAVTAPPVSYGRPRPPEKPDLFKAAVPSLKKDDTDAPLDLPIPQFAQIQPASWRWLKGAAAVILGLAIGATAYQTRSHWLPQTIAKVRPALPREPVPFLALNTSDDNGQLHIRWDRNSPAVQKGLGAVLEIKDGGPLPRYVHLDPVQLKAGTFAYARESERVDVTLTVDERRGSQVKEVASFLGKLPEKKPVEAADDPKVRETLAVQAAQTAKLQQDLDSQAAKTKKLEKDLKDVREQFLKEQRRRMASQLPDAGK